MLATWKRILAHLAGRRSRQQSFARQRQSRPRVEILEDRSAPAVFTVINTASAGAGTLRDAITQANNTAGADVINFNSQAAGVQTIALTLGLPTITEQVTIDGYSQPGSSANTLPLNQGDNAVLLIELNGSKAGG